MLITFYSYKGGVGRTMAVANVAAQLANVHGLNVLCIDWDLEAPGLHYYFDLTDQDFKTKPGLLTLLEQLKQGKKPKLADFVRRVDSRSALGVKHGRLSIIHCGKQDSTYNTRVAAFDWNEFYSDSNGYKKMETFRKEIVSAFDVCLIDARAGQSETNVVPSAQLPDAIVFLLSASKQSAEGVFSVAKKIAEVRKQLQDARPLHSAFVPSRVFSREPMYDRWLRKHVKPLYEKAIKEGYHDPTDQPNGLNQAVLDLIPTASIGEQLPVITSRANRLTLGYADLAELVLDYLRPVDTLWRPPREEWTGSNLEDQIKRFREFLEEAASRGDERSAATIQLQLSNLLRAANRFEEARSLVLSALTLLESNEDRSGIALALHSLGQISNASQDHQRAIRYYKEALETLPPDLEIPRSVVLHDLGVVHRVIRDLGPARKYLAEALELKQAHAEPRDVALTLHQIANLLFSESKFDEAHEAFEKAIELSLEANDERGAAIGYHQIGNLFATKGDLKNALLSFDRAMEIRKGVADTQSLAITQRRVGDIQSALGDLSAAQETYRTALTSAMAVSDTRNIIQLHRRLAGIHLQNEDWKSASDEAEAAVRLAFANGFRKEKLACLMLSAEAKIRQDDGRHLALARREIVEAESLIEKTDNVRHHEKLNELKAMLK
jgi:tetratricopeptide (TPR) repeat protein/cellulose biosynthesis protein BcsQ